MERVESNADTAKDNHDWLYPELMSQDKLVKILRQRYIRRTDLEQLQKDELVDLYYKYIIPLPQRTYRKNRRGQEMTRRQAAMEKKKGTSFQGEESSDRKRTRNSGPESRFLTSYNLPSSGERIKPPPSCIDFGKKKIKLSSGSATSTENKSSTNTAVGKVTLKRNSASSGIDHKSEFSKESGHDNMSVSPKKTIKLNNKLSVSASQTDTNSSKMGECTPVNSSETSEHQPMDTSTESNSSKKTFKASKISWP
eukprot:XP_011451329.1 PREDICTED: ashwin [Crassostrea gigas]